MSDLAPLTSPGQGEERDHVPELPLGPSVAGAYANAAIHNARQSSESVNSSPVIQHSPGPHHGSHSNVDLAMFDPAGVNRLGRTLSRMSQEPAEGTKVPGPRSLES